MELASGAQANVNPEENSLTRAYYELDTLAGGELPGMLVRITKRIPIGSGLGGGSSDAAGFLKMIREMAARNASQKGSLARISQMSENDWLELASQVGADVPAFMVQGPVRARGFGEKVEAVALEGLGGFRCILNVPEVSFSTASMYAKVGSYSSFNHAEEFLREWSTDGPKAAFQIARNDFTPIARDASSEVGSLLDALASFDYPLISVTGSGSCVFAVAKAEDADKANLPVYRFID
jgi:4-diphosphocytidyl-2-C-methyl-D-erythritol kinase